MRSFEGRGSAAKWGGLRAPGRKWEWMMAGRSREAAGWRDGCGVQVARVVVGAVGR